MKTDTRAAINYFNHFSVNFFCLIYFMFLLHCVNVGQCEMSCTDLTRFIHVILIYFKELWLPLNRHCEHHRLLNIWIIILKPCITCPFPVNCKNSNVMLILVSSLSVFWYFCLSSWLMSASASFPTATKAFKAAGRTNLLCQAGIAFAITNSPVSAHGCLLTGNRLVIYPSRQCWAVKAFLTFFKYITT